MLVLPQVLLGCSRHAGMEQGHLSCQRSLSMSSLTCLPSLHNV